jgi:hypothetical protein
MKYNCSFCPARTDRIRNGWGHAKLVTPGGMVEVTFCPKHRNEAEDKLDMAFGLPRGYPKSEALQSGRR